MRCSARTRAGLGLLTALLLSGPSGAQNATGDGRVLDADQRVGGDGRVPASPTVDYRLRNLVVTNNVAGGRGFRGAIGYTAPDDFRGRLGSDDLYAFERRAGAYSSLGAIVGTMGNTPLNLGQELGLVEVRRSAVGETLSAVRSRSDERAQQASLADAWFQGIVLAHHSSAIRPMGDAPYQMLGQVRTEDGMVMNVTASSVRGIQQTPVTMDTRMIGLSTFERARMIQEGAAGPGTLIPGRAWSPPLEDLRVADGRVTGTLIDNRVNLAIPPGYSDMISGMVTQTGATDPNAAGTTLQSTLQQLRDMLEAEDAEALPDAGVPEAPPGDNVTPVPTAPEEPVHGMVGQPEAPKRVLPPPESIALLRHGRAMDDLAADDSVGRFSEIMSEAERRLRRGEYLAAERQFMRAIRYMPDHPTAMAGLVNAQVGAGLHGTAGSSIRSLFARHPEMIDVEYGGGLLPEAARLHELARQLQDRAEAATMTPAQALTLAFIGRQVGDSSLMTVGLERFEALVPGDGLPGLLRQVWLD